MKGEETGAVSGNVAPLAAAVAHGAVQAVPGEVPWLPTIVARFLVPTLHCQVPRAIAVIA